MKNDSAVSELLGYAILAGVALIATIGIYAGAGGVIDASVRNAGLAEATQSVSAFARTAEQSATAHNEYPQALEMIVPQGYDLYIVDRNDDWRTIKVTIDGADVAKLRPGSISLRSAFRSVTCEAGGVFIDDGGSYRTARKPQIFVAGPPTGQQLLFVNVPCLSAETAIVPSGQSAVMTTRFEEAHDNKWTMLPRQQVSIEVRTDNTEGWRQALESQGFTVGTGDGRVTGYRRGISVVQITETEICVGQQ